MGRAGSGLEFHINSGSGRVGSSLVGRVGSSQENGPTSDNFCIALNSRPNNNNC